MEQYAGTIWAIFGVFLVILEIFTLGFVLFWFGIGAFAAALAAYFGIGMLGQFAVFAGVSTILTVMSRTIFDNYYPHRDDEGLKMGMDTLPGQIGTVATSSKGALNAATVRVYGSDWKAFPVGNDVQLVEGEKVEVVKVEGASLYVRRYKRELAGWKSDS